MGRTAPWLRWQVLAWLIACAWLLWSRQHAVTWYALPDTDDNMRMAQVRAFLNGQGWYDLRQYKLDPPRGFDMHWSRIVDLPIAAVQLLARPFTGALMAERISAAVAPLFPLLAAMIGTGRIVRRLIAPQAWIVSSVVIVIGCNVALLMFSPMRVDHHGWQLAALVWAVAGLVEPDHRTGGLMIGAASAFSLAIGLELLPFLAIVGAAVALRWAFDAGEAPRLGAYGLALALGTGIGFLLFASIANRAVRCDVLSPVWLSTMMVAGALAFAASRVTNVSVPVRLGIAAGVGAATAALFAVAFPQCLGAPEQISDELATKWFDNIREAKPLYANTAAVIVQVVVLPIAGLIGAAWMAMRHRRGARFGDWAPIAFVSAVSLALCLWQTRMGPAAQLLGVPGAVALLWILVPRLRASRSVFARTFGVVGVVLVASGIAGQLIAPRLPAKPQSAWDKAVGRANARCMTVPALAAIAKLPATTMFTFVDMGPRLITVTHHKAIAGPYHRNGGAILDVHRAFDGSPAHARATMKAHGATHLLTCPRMNESTIYRARSKGGFYDRLEGGAAFDWLTPVPLPKDSPFRLWRVG